MRPSATDQVTSPNSQTHYVDLCVLSFKGETLTYKVALEKEDEEVENEEQEVEEEKERGKRRRRIRMRGMRSKRGWR